MMESDEKKEDMKDDMAEMMMEEPAAMNEGGAGESQ